MLTADMKLFIQLQPDTAGLDALQSIQDQLRIPANQRVGRGTLHLTVVHIGVLYKMLGTLHKQTGTPKHELLQRANTLANSLEVLAGKSEFANFTLQPNGFANFGSKHGTFVVTLRSNEQLNTLHAASLQILQTYFKDCGITDVAEFMRADANFRHALTLRPHITLAKGFTSDINSRSLQRLSLGIMPVVYAN